MKALARAEYITLRLVRRFLFREGIANRLSGLIPYYRKSINETRPDAIIAAYCKHIGEAGLTIEGKRVLEVGAGRTNSVAYGLVEAGAAKVWVLEPYVRYDAKLDLGLLEARHGTACSSVSAHVERVARFSDIPEAEIDLLLSNSVLEHVTELDPFFTQCLRVLSGAGVMIHVVDYRDHFFKYPYAFLTYSDATWARWLDPGDLPRWRIDDHLSALENAGFDVDVIDRQTLHTEFEQVRGELLPRYAETWETASISQATLVARHAS